MKKLEFKTRKGEFILEEASDKNLGRVLVKYMTEEQFAEVLDYDANLNFYLCGQHPVKMADGSKSQLVGFECAKKAFESLINSLVWYLFENPVKVPMHKSNNINEMSEYIEAESKTLYNPILLKKV